MFPAQRAPPQRGWVRALLVVLSVYVMLIHAGLFSPLIHVPLLQLAAFLWLTQGRSRWPPALFTVAHALVVAVIGSAYSVGRLGAWLLAGYRLATRVTVGATAAWEMWTHAIA